MARNGSVILGILQRPCSPLDQIIEGWGSQPATISIREIPMADQQKMDDIEELARMAARMAGRDPDQHLKIALGEVVPFDDLLWRYPDFLTRAEAAYHALAALA